MTLPSSVALRINEPFSLTVTVALPSSFVVTPMSFPSMVIFAPLTGSTTGAQSASKVASHNVNSKLFPFVVLISFSVKNRYLSDQFCVSEYTYA